MFMDENEKHHPPLHRRAVTTSERSWKKRYPGMAKFPLSASSLMPGFETERSANEAKILLMEPSTTQR